MILQSCLSVSVKSLFMRSVTHETEAAQSIRVYWQTLQWRHNGLDGVSNHSTSLTIVYSAVYSGADQTKNPSSASPAFVQGFHRGPVYFPHKGPVTRKMFPFHDVIIFYLPYTYEITVFQLNSEYAIPFSVCVIWYKWIIDSLVFYKDRLRFWIVWSKCNF